MSRPDKYRRVGVAPAQSLDADSNQSFFSQEQFRDWNYTAPGVYALDSGVLHRFLLPANCQRHFIWIAAGAHYHGESGGVQIDYWFVQGCLQFYRAGRPVGCAIFGDACQQSYGVPAQIAAARRPIIRTAPDANGSVQPSLRIQRSIANVTRNNLDLACTEIPILADAVDYVCDASRIEITSANSILIVTGARIVSVP